MTDVCLYNYEGKADRLAAALVELGYDVTDHRGAISLVDIDIQGRVPYCDRRPTIVYPHGANPQWLWAIKPLHHRVQAMLAHTEGHAEHLRNNGVDVPIFVIGWSYSELAKRRYPGSLPHFKQVLFCPHHALADGSIHPEALEVNREVLATLVATGMAVKVRTYDAPSRCGLEPANYPGVEWLVNQGLAHADIDTADLVVADPGTVVYLSVARGAPTICLPELPWGTPEGLPCPPAWHEKDAGYTYPYWWGKEPLDHLIDLVAWPNGWVDQWAQRWVGGPLDLTALDAAVRYALS